VLPAHASSLGGTCDRGAQYVIRIGIGN
jgi:hypothetical protein